MTTGICERCGGPNPPFAQTCQWCSASLPRPPVSPTEPLPPGSPPPLVFETRARPPPPPPPSRAWIAVAVGVVLIAILVVVAAISLISTTDVSSTPGTGPPEPSPGGAVNVTEVLVSSPDNACGLNGTTHPGFNTTPTGGWTLTWSLPISGALPCRVSNVASNTPGFTAVPDQLPVNVTAPDTPMQVPVFVPDGSYAGVLSLTFT